MALQLSAGQRPESTFFNAHETGPFVQRSGPPTTRRMAGSRRSAAAGLQLPMHRAPAARPRIQAVNPERNDQRGSHRGAARYHSIRSFIPGRDAVERCAGRLKENRRIATRYDKLAASFPARVDSARTRQTMNINLSDTAQALTRICWTFGKPAKNNAGALRGGQFSTSGQQSALFGFSRCSRKDSTPPRKPTAPFPYEPTGSGDCGYSR